MVIKSEQYIALERIITGLFSISPNMAKRFETAALVKQFSQNNKNLAAAFVFFINSIYKHIEESTLSPIQVLLNLRTAITDNLLYVDITASSEEDAYTIFEILNARGSALEGHELLKNFILRGIRPDGDVDTAKTTWSEIESLLGNNIERFVKHYATHKYRTSVQEGISDYKLIRINRITISAGTSGLLLSFCSAAVSCIMPQKASFSKTFCHKLPDFT